MKNFFKYAFFVVLIILLFGTLFDVNETSTLPSLDSNALVVENNEEVEIHEVATNSPSEANIFAKIGAFISKLIYQIFSFIFSIISHIFTFKVPLLNFMRF